MKRRLISIFLLIHMITPMLGTFAFLQYRKSKVRHEVKERILRGMSKEDLVFMSFTPEQAEKLDWEHEREFEFNGEMYDVVYRVEDDTSLSMWCWPDNEETRLNEQLAQLIHMAQDNDPKSTEGKQYLLIVLRSMFCDQWMEYAITNQNVEFHPYTLYDRNYETRGVEPPTPPPLKG